MQKYIHLIYFMLAISIIGSLTTFTTSMGVLSLVYPVLAEEKQVEKSQDMNNIVLKDKRELHINNDKVNVEFAKKDKSDSDLANNNNCKSNKVLKGASNKKDLKILSECEN